MIQYLLFEAKVFIIDGGVTSRSSNSCNKKTIFYIKPQNIWWAQKLHQGWP